MVIDIFYYIQNYINIVLKVWHLNVTDSTTWRKILEFRFKLQFSKSIDVLTNINLYSTLDFSIFNRGIDYLIT